MLALSIRQPYVEEILRGIRTVEYRTRPARIIGQEFYIYAAKNLPPGGEPQRFSRLGCRLGELPTGVLVGTARISRCERAESDGGKKYEWHLADVKRLPEVIKPSRRPQPTWFNPF